MPQRPNIGICKQVFESRLAALDDEVARHSEVASNRHEELAVELASTQANPDDAAAAGTHKTDMLQPKLYT